MYEPFLQIIDVSKRFDNVVALDKVNLKIAKSEKFINWIGESLEEWLRVFIMFIVKRKLFYIEKSIC